MTGLKLSDLGAKVGDVEVDFSEIGTNEGIDFVDLLNLQQKQKQEIKEIIWKKYLGGERLNADDCYCLDIETIYSALNAYVKVITLLDTKEKRIYFFTWGSKVVEVERIEKNVRAHGFEVEFKEFETEREMLEAFVEHVKAKPKAFLGHNVAHFDLSLIAARLRYYGIKGLRFYGYRVGSGSVERYLYFTYEIKEDAEGEELKDEDEKREVENRFLIVDTLYIARTLQIPGSLKELAKDSPFSKKEIDYTEYEKPELSYDAVIYAIYDVLSLPYVYRDLMARVEGVVDKLKIEKRASVQCYEHAWEKGSGTIAGAFLKHLIGRVSDDIDDWNAAYLGGLTRTWRTGKHKPKNGKQIRYLDLTSAYPFSIVKQGLLDIYAGNAEFFRDVSFDEDVYNDLIFSSLLLCKVKRGVEIFVELDVEKPEIGEEWNVSNRFSISYIRSFDKGKKVADISHSFGILKAERGDEVILTKVEYEINKLLNPDFEKCVSPIRILYGARAKSREESMEYIELYRMRKKLKKEGDPAQVGFKVLLNSVYGKTAQNVEEFFTKSIPAAITGFVRYQIMAIVIKALQLGMDVFYSDTDSLYAAGSERQLKALMDYANKLNEYPKELFGEDNLKDEGENIICFLSVKRKRYAKIVEKEDGSIVIYVKGGSYTDINWRHLLLYLVLLTNRFTIEGIQKALQEKDFPEELPKLDEEFVEKFRKLAERVYREYTGKDLKEIFPQLNRSAKITLLRNFHAGKLGYHKESFQHRVLRAWEFEAYNRFLKLHGYDTLERLKEVFWSLVDLYHERAKAEKEGNRKVSKWQEFYNLLKEELSEEGYGEWIAESGESERFAYHFRKLAKRLGMKDINLKDTRFYLNLFEKLREYWDLRELVSSIAPKSVEINDFDNSYIGDWINSLDNEIYSLEDELLALLKELEGLREKYPMPKAYIGVFFGVYNKGERLDNGKRKVVNQLAEKMEEIAKEFFDGEKAEKQALKFVEELEGLFYSNQYLFDEPKDYDILKDESFDLRYELYQSMPEVIPVIRAKDYVAILTTPVEIDTVEFRMKEGIWIRKLEDNKDKRAITNAAMKEHCGIPGYVRGIKSKPVSFRLRVVDLYNVESIEILRDKKEYANVTLFLSYIGGLFSKFRVNKFRMLAGKEENEWQINIFEAYWAAYRLSKLLHKWLEKKFEKYGVKIELPPFTHVYQTDISQQVDEDFFWDISMEAMRIARELKRAKQRGSPRIVWEHSDGKDLTVIEFTNSLALKVYDKAASAMNKIASEKMTDYERRYFKKEAEQGWRAEQSFVAERSLDVAISYCFVLNAIDCRSYFELLRNWDKIVNRRINTVYKNKIMKVSFSSRVRGWFSFGRDKVEVLFEAGQILIGWESQVMFDRGNVEKVALGESFPLAPLEGRGENLFAVGKHAPPTWLRGLKLKIGFYDRLGLVFWEFEREDWEKLNDERVNVREFEWLKDYHAPLLTRF